MMTRLTLQAGLRDVIVVGSGPAGLNAARQKIKLLENARTINACLFARSERVEPVHADDLASRFKGVTHQFELSRWARR